MQRTFSVVIAAFNAARWISETLDSIEGQSFSDFEVIVVDDGSTDETGLIARRHPVVTQYIRRANSGQPASRNVGIRASMGRFVAFVDADDIWFPTKLELQCRLHSLNPELLWSYSNALYFDNNTGSILGLASDNNKLVSGCVLPELLRRCFIPSPTVVVRRDAFDQVGFFEESRGAANEDWNMWTRLAEQYPVGVIENALAGVRLHETSMSRQLHLESDLESAIAIISRAIATNPAVLRKVGRCALFNAHCRVAARAIAGERRQAAFQILYRGVMASPKSTARAVPLLLLAALPWVFARTIRSRRRAAAIKRYSNLRLPNEKMPTNDLGGVRQERRRAP